MGICEEVVKSRNKIIASNKEKVVGRSGFSGLHRISGGARQQESIYTSPQGAAMVRGYQAVPVVQHHQGGSLRRINSFRGGARNLGSAQGLYTSSPYPLLLKGGHRHYPIPWVTDQGIGEWKCANNPGSAGRARVWQDPGVSLARTVSSWGSAVGLGNII